MTSVAGEDELMRRSLIAGNVRAVLRTVARCCELEQTLGRAEGAPPAFLLLAGELASATLKLWRRYKALYGLKGGPAGAAANARYDALVQEARASRERRLQATGRVDIDPEEYRLRLEPGDRLYDLWEQHTAQLVQLLKSCVDDDHPKTTSTMPPPQPHGPTQSVRRAL
ncbi:hypothetical protein SPI_05705 [Niveomyces insectorum RCEF 264]|uniref:Uncharacterized protein n=1 Tax=Niveomyces insectorum RCEF 264 TaxID=1081102 RepID=A0A167TGK1_9HYPO|nr:hypothetical protein SPI_05705 [Niveomyces insectorum RCEF 264]